MADFPATIEAQLAGRKVQVGVLVEFQFVSETVRLWNGFGSLITTGAKTWLGTAALGSVEGLEQSMDGTAPAMTFTLSGVDETFALKAKGEQSEYHLQPVITFLQFFDDNWQTLDSPFAVAYRQMDTLKSRKVMTDDGPVNSVSITAETVFATRRRPPHGYYTDRSQQLLSPGDLGLTRVAGINNKIVPFPAF